MEYYDLLGVSQDATDGDIKKGYRKMAMVCHPDKNPDDTEGAGIKFKQVSHAYQVLSDAETRLAYDRHGPDFREKEGGRSGRGSGGGGFGTSAEEMFFEMFFGGGFGGMPGFGFDPRGGGYYEDEDEYEEEYDEEDDLYETEAEMLARLHAQRRAEAAYREGRGGSNPFHFTSGAQRRQPRPPPPPPRPKTPPQARTLVVTHQVTLEHLGHGNKSDRKVERDCICVECEGTGKAKQPKEPKPKPCYECDGKGSTKKRKTCPRCKGVKEIITEQDKKEATWCLHCLEGSGLRKETKTFAVNVTPGMTDGERITGKGAGHRSLDSAPGDIVFKLKLLPHDTFDLIAPKDLLISVRCTHADASAGFTRVILVDLAGRGLQVTIEPNSIGKKGIKTIRIKGEGLPAGKDGSPKGDLWVAFEVVSSQTVIPPVASTEVVPVQHMLLKCKQTYKPRKQEDSPVEPVPISASESTKKAKKKKKGSKKEAEDKSEKSPPTPSLPSTSNETKPAAVPPTTELRSTPSPLASASSALPSFGADIDDFPPMPKTTTSKDVRKPAPPAASLSLTTSVDSVSATKKQSQPSGHVTSASVPSSSPPNKVVPEDPPRVPTPPPAPPPKFTDPVPCPCCETGIRSKWGDDVSIAMIKHMGSKKCLEREFELKGTQGGVDYNAHPDDTPLPLPVTSGVPLPRKNSDDWKASSTVSKVGEVSSDRKATSRTMTKLAAEVEESSSLKLAGMTEEEQIALAMRVSEEEDELSRLLKLSMQDRTPVQPQTKTQSTTSGAPRHPVSAEVGRTAPPSSARVHKTEKSAHASSSSNIDSTSPASATRSSTSAPKQAATRSQGPAEVSRDGRTLPDPTPVRPLVSPVETGTSTAPKGLTREERKKQRDSRAAKLARNPDGNDASTSGEDPSRTGTPMVEPSSTSSLPGLFSFPFSISAPAPVADSSFEDQPSLAPLRDAVSSPQSAPIAPVLNSVRQHAGVDEQSVRSGSDKPTPSTKNKGTTSAKAPRHPPRVTPAWQAQEPLLRSVPIAPLPTPPPPPATAFQSGVFDPPGAPGYSPEYDVVFDWSAMVQDSIPEPPASPMISEAASQPRNGQSFASESERQREISHGSTRLSESDPSIWSPNAKPQGNGWDLHAQPSHSSAGVDEPRFGNVYTPRDDPPHQTSRSRHLPNIQAQRTPAAAAPTTRRPSVTTSYQPTPQVRPPHVPRPSQYQPMYHTSPSTPSYIPPPHPPPSAFSSAQSYQEHLTRHVPSTPSPPPPPASPFAHMSDYHREVMGPILQEQQRKAERQRMRERRGREEDEGPVTTFDVPRRGMGGEPVLVSGGSYMEGRGRRGR